MGVARAHIKSFPLVFSSITANSKLRAPAFEEDGPVVVVVELALLCSSAPESVKARSSLIGRAKSMGTRDGCGMSPAVARGLVDVVVEDHTKPIASICRVWHEASVPSTLGGCLSSELEIAHKGTHDGAKLKFIVGIIISGSSTHHRLCGDDEVVSKRNSCTKLLVRNDHVEVLGAVLEAYVVGITEVNASVRSSSIGGANSEVHEVVAYQSDNAAGVLSSLVGVVPDSSIKCLILLHHTISNCLILILRETGSLCHCSSGACEVIRCKGLHDGMLMCCMVTLNNGLVVSNI